MTIARNEFSVYQFFPDDLYERVNSFVSAEKAVRTAKFLTTNVAARFGITKRVIVTDGGDSIVFEWIAGKGVTFPPQEGPPNETSQTDHSPAATTGQPPIQGSEPTGRAGTDRPLLPTQGSEGSALPASAERQEET